MGDKVTTSIRVSSEVWKMAKKYAIDTNITVGQLVEIALIHEMQGKQI